ncbi:ABC transporter permease, partial [Sulfolobus sp. B1]
VPSWGYLIRVAIDTPRVIYTNAWIWWILPPLAFLILLDMSFLLIILDLERNYNISTLSAKLLRAFW